MIKCFFTGDIHIINNKYRIDGDASDNGNTPRSPILSPIHFCASRDSSCAISLEI